MKILEEIPDLRTDNRAEPFWRLCERLLKNCEPLLHADTIPVCPKQFTVCITEVRRVWKWMEVFKWGDFSPPPGHEIMARFPSWRPHNGTHRATALRILEQPVPALLVQLEPFHHKE